ncbi:hypothetical protein A1O7_07569 [Cladophialophora yegresii CBS 114405]|uniref:Uncharacterized protein n=1 Tax=Cladophialophora yegresii CBS 114405 TaxID=1182544 RepID=W9VND2_9EURO|nr:uncharacterized protein A1O7_07569 [Cladophialophora yegresii CBS 114405]EXJ57222.1 hypothetical protein A1O7_07569 [Cladophialophora yegresii CBS 114405]
MPVTQFAQIKPGLPVSIVLKADQRTGRQVQGTVSQLLTRHNHPRGIKVKLTDGRVGRVQQILPQTHSHHDMSSNNPWSNTESNGNPYTSPTSQQNQGAAQGYYQSDASQYQSQSHGHQQPQQPQQHSINTSAPSQGIHRSDTEQLLAEQGDRAAQVEHMQQYEANAPQSEDDRIQAQLQKEFPNIDSSLIAAIYGERKGQGDLGEVRELLQELNTS